MEGDGVTVRTKFRKSQKSVTYALCATATYLAFISFKNYSVSQA